MTKRELENLWRDEEITDLKTVMSIQEGRRFIWKLLGDASIFSPCFSPEEEGKRRQGLALLGEIMEHCPASYLTMQREAINHAQKRKEEIKRCHGDGADDDRSATD